MLRERFSDTLGRYIGRTGKDSGGDGFLKLFIAKRLIHGSATALLGVFVPIYIYTITGTQFWIVAAFYALLSLLYALFLVPGMQYASTIGFSRALVLGGGFSVILYSILYVMNESNVWFLMPALVVAIVFFRIFHWVPYHVDFASFTKKGDRGRVVSLNFATVAFLGAVGPILAGFIIESTGYNALFAIAVSLLFLATISYAYVPESNERFTWTYGETIRALFGKQYRHVVLGSAASSAEVVVTLVAWPIFLYEILNGDLFSIGALSTLIVAVTILVQLFVGKYLDAKSENAKQTLFAGSLLHAVGWLIKIFVFSALQVFFIGLYHNITKILTKTPFSAVFYDMSADQGHYKDEFTVVSEMAAHFGRTVSLILMALLAYQFGIEVSFVVGVVASVAINLIYQRVS